MRPYAAALAAVLCLSGVSCGGDSSSPSSPSSTPTSPSNGSMSATIDGVPWSAAAITVQYGPNVPAPFYIKAWDSTLQNPTTGRQIAFSTGVYRTGTFVACPAPSCDPGIFFDLTVNGTDWYAGPLPGGSGTLVISTMTAHNAVGSFSFTGVAQNGSTKPVISGTFNVTY